MRNTTARVALVVMFLSGTLLAEAQTPQQTRSMTPPPPAAYRAADNPSRTLEGASNLGTPPSARARALLAVERDLALRGPDGSTPDHGDALERAEARAEARQAVIDRFFVTVHRLGADQSRHEAADDESIASELLLNPAPSATPYLWGDGGGLSPGALSMLQDQWAREHLTVQVRSAGDERELFWVDAVCPALVQAASRRPGPRAGEDEQRDTLAFGFASRGEAIRALRPILEADASSDAKACLAELESAELESAELESAELESAELESAELESAERNTSLDDNAGPSVP